MPDDDEPALPALPRNRTPSEMQQMPRQISRDEEKSKHTKCQMNQDQTNQHDSPEAVDTIKFRKQCIGRDGHAHGSRINCEQLVLFMNGIVLSSC